jgi:hypothetical protein
VPEITFLFWVVKILTTCGGEAVSDYLAVTRHDIQPPADREADPQMSPPLAPGSSSRRGY